MTTYKQANGAPKPRPVDHEAAAAEERRREEVANSDPVQRGVRLAQEQALSNIRMEVDARLAGLRKASLLKNVNTPGRDNYDRCHQRLVKACERLAEATGELITIPAWIPAPTAADEPTITIGAPKVGTSYRETRGTGPSGKGLPLTGPTDPDWMNK